MSLLASSAASRCVLASEPVVSSHWPWPQTSSRPHLLTQPVQVVAVQVRDVVHRIAEVRGAATLTPGVPGGRVVVAGEAQSQREQVSPLQREVRRVEGAETAAEGSDLQRAAAVGVRSTAPRRR